MQIAKLNFRWEEESHQMSSWGYFLYKQLFCEDIATSVFVYQEASGKPIAVIAHDGKLTDKDSFTDIRDAEEYAETEFKKYLNRFIVNATPAYDIQAFAKF